MMMGSCAQPDLLAKNPACEWLGHANLAYDVTFSAPAASTTRVKLHSPFDHSVGIVGVCGLKKGEARHDRS
jgi:hypothetical protein